MSSRDPSHDRSSEDLDALHNLSRTASAKQRFNAGQNKGEKLDTDLDALSSKLADKIGAKRRDSESLERKRSLKASMGELSVKEQDENAIAMARRKKLLRHHIMDLKAVGAFTPTTADKAKEKKKDKKSRHKQRHEYSDEEEQVEKRLHHHSSRRDDEEDESRDYSRDNHSRDERSFRKQASFGRKESNHGQQQQAESSSESSEEDFEEDSFDDDNNHLEGLDKDGGVTKAVTIQINAADIIGKKQSKRIAVDTEQDHMKYRKNARIGATDDTIAYVESKTTGQFVRVHRDQTKDMTEQPEVQSYDFNHDVDALIDGSNTIQKLLAVIYVCFTGFLAGSAFLGSHLISNAGNEINLLSWYSPFASDVRMTYFFLLSYCLAYSIWDWNLYIMRANRIDKLMLTATCILFMVAFVITMIATPIDDFIFIKYETANDWFITDTIAFTAFKDGRMQKWYSLVSTRFYCSLFAWMLLCYKLFTLYASQIIFLNEFDDRDKAAIHMNENNTNMHNSSSLTKRRGSQGAVQPFHSV